MIQSMTTSFSLLKVSVEILLRRQCMATRNYDSRMVLCFFLSCCCKSNGDILIQIHCSLADDAVLSYAVHVMASETHTRSVSSSFHFQCFSPSERNPWKEKGTNPRHDADANVHGDEVGDVDASSY